jgi:hypothetical protein
MKILWIVISSLLVGCTTMEMAQQSCSEVSGDVAKQKCISDFIEANMTSAERQQRDREQAFQKVTIQVPLAKQRAKHVILGHA